MTLIIPNEIIQKAFNEVKRIRDAYNIFVLGPVSTTRSVKSLLDICRTDLQATISLHEHNETHRNHFIKSVYLKESNEKSNESYTILLMAELNNCWKRFCICKELFHVLLDNPEIRETNLQEHVDDFFANGASESRTSSQGSSQSEVVAEFAAMEFLFPYAERKKVIDDGNFEFMEIASRYKIPRVYTEIYLSNYLMQILESFEY